ncbi:MAG: hypothetical protein QOD75_2028 [Blastocatellia bacterium]|jgi:hypothetical protein|nr:hypothetical protein [Blastocatellia bacterium]
MKHDKHLNTLLQSYLQGCGKSLDQKKLFWMYLCGWVPEPAAPQVFQEQGLKFTGNEKNFLYTSYRELRKDQRTEHLEPRQLNDKLSGLILEVLEHKDEYKNQAKLKGRINEFLEEVLKPEEDFKVLFRVVNLSVKVEDIQFWDCIITQYDSDQLAKWGFDPKKNVPIGLDAFENQTVIIVSEKGTNVAEMVTRARLKATRRLRVLQSYLKVEFIHDQQLYFELSTEYAVRNESTGKVVSWGFDKKNTAIAYDYPDFLKEHVGEANRDFERINQLPPKVRGPIERTLHWIGSSISEVDPDIKISFLCTALETLLTTKADRLKGEKIAYRGYLLGQEVNSENYQMPQKVLGVYERRSTIVHGSDIGVATVRDYWLMLDFAQTTLKNFIQFVSSHNLTKPSAVFAKLLESQHLAPLRKWLEEEYVTVYSTRIAESIREEVGEEKPTTSYDGP